MQEGPVGCHLGAQGSGCEQFLGSKDPSPHRSPHSTPRRAQMKNQEVMEG